MSNISKAKRDEMLAFLEKLKEKNDDDESLRALNEIENALNEKKYGLVWEKHSEKVDEMLENNIAVFEEIKERKIKSLDDNHYNFLLEGDNLHSLKLLEKTHKGKIDVIYIDPPYNTKNKEFKYNDKRVGLDDAYRHSKWISFMSERLEIAKELLSDEGVIFISIDDNEQAQLKLLCDEIFGEENFINNIILKTKNAAGASGGGEDKRLKKNVEFLLVYCKNQIIFEQFNLVYKLNEIGELINYYSENGISWKYTSVLLDRGEKRYIGSTQDGSGEEIKIYERTNPKFTSVNKLVKEESLTISEVFNKYFSDIHMTTMPQSSIRGRVVEYIGIENLNKNSLYSIEYIPKSGRNKGMVYEQFYKGEKARLLAWFSDVGICSEEGVYKKDIEGTLWTGIEWNNLNKQGNVSFENGKKPIELIIRILKMIGKENMTVLDFFCGSATTAHAVMQLNKEDGGNSKYILCTNNENKICEEVAYKRIKNIQEELPHNLKYFRTDFVPKFDEEISVYEKLKEYIVPLIELENGVEIDGKDNLVIFDEEKVLEGVKGANDGANIYITSDIFLEDEVEKLVRKKQLKIKTIPEYYFKNELLEVGEL